MRAILLILCIQYYHFQFFLLFFLLLLLLAMQVNDIGWKMRRKLRASGVHQSDTAKAVRESSAQLQKWIGETSVGKSLADKMHSLPSPPPAADASAPAADANAAERDSLTDADVAKWEQEASRWLEQVLSPSSTAPDGAAAATSIATSSVESARAPLLPAGAIESVSPSHLPAPAPVPAPAPASSPPPPQAPANPASGDSLASKLKAFDQWFDATSVGKWLSRK